MPNEPRAHWLERPIAERLELAERVTKLVAFMETDAFETIPTPDASLLVRQLEHMTGYLEVLNVRCSRAGEPAV